MEKIINFVKENSSYLIGGIIGSVGGFLYWYYVGCSTGTCPITSSPVMSILWGALLGGILFSMIFTKKNKSSKSDLKELLANGALLLDVRTRGEYADEHAKNSTNIPLDELSSSLSKLNKEQHIVVVCASGVRSAQAVSLMKKKGFTNCYNGGSWVSFKE